MLSEMRFHILPRGAPPGPPCTVWASDMQNSPLSHPRSANQRPPEASAGIGPAQHPAAQTSYQQDLGAYEKNATRHQAVPSFQDE